MNPLRRRPLQPRLFLPPPPAHPTLERLSHRLQLFPKLLHPLHQSSMRRIRRIQIQHLKQPRRTGILGSVYIVLLE